jgi:hypothetical protein
LESPIGTLLIGPVGAVSGIGGKGGRELAEELSAGIVVDSKNCKEKIQSKGTMAFMAEDMGERWQDCLSQGLGNGIYRNCGQDAIDWRRRKAYCLKLIIPNTAKAAYLGN